MRAAPTGTSPRKSRCLQEAPKCFACVQSNFDILEYMARKEKGPTGTSSHSFHSQCGSVLSGRVQSSHDILAYTARTMAQPTHTSSSRWDS